MPKKPFSGKAKKAQLLAKRERKAGGKTLLLGNNYPDDPEESSEKKNKLYDADLQGDRTGKNRYKLQFKPESKKEIAEKREKAQNPIEKVTDLISTTEMYFDTHHDFPERPEWKEGWSKEKLEMSEQRYFREYVSKKLENEDTDTDSTVSFFELNLETWRQFWRVIEMSDVLLLILDIRYATATFPPSLYDFVVKKNKSLILVLNKIDLIPPELSSAWKAYLTDKFPRLHVVFFTSFPSYNLVNVSRGGLRIKKLKANFKIAKEGALQILKICEEVANKNLDDWKKRINGEDNTREFTVEDDESKVLTIGTIGHPNVGKSSLINSLLGKKLVSVSRTPGHTKHFQTIFLTKNVRLCDCPGLVFPSKVPKPLQILMGSFPISQVREPYSVVSFLAERLDLPELLNVKLDEDEEEWSAFGICSAWAELRRYTTARTSRPDTYRAANEILRMALEGKICLALEPPDFDPDTFVNHPDTEFVEEVLGKEEDMENITEEDEEDVSSSEDDDQTQTTSQLEYPPHKNRQPPPLAEPSNVGHKAYRNPFTALPDAESD